MKQRFRSGMASGLILLVSGCGGDSGESVANRPAAAPATIPADAAVPTESDPPRQRPGGIGTRLIPPGAVIGTAPDPRAPGITFRSPRPPARLLDWLRATANGADFILESEMEEGAEYVINGRTREGGQPFTVRVAPGNDGGTTGIVLVAGR